MGKNRAASISDFRMKSDEFEAEITKLRIKYKAKLAISRCEILNFIDQIEEFPHDSINFDQMKILIHTLAGNGATLGFATISNAASKLDSYLQEFAIREYDLPTLKQMSRDLTKAIEKSIRADF